uniref:TFIIS central domain-containing protein n=1 Tax=Romanomermis culicivorax TaxID=13658 RepID=A0A915KEL2_ROMCU
PKCDSPSDIRQKSVQLLFEAIKFEKIDHKARLIAEKIEEIIFMDNNQDVNNKNYKAKIRSRVMNLRDKNNPDLLKNVIIGRITAEKFARMSVEEMASDRMKNLRKSIEEESIQERQSKDPSSVGLAKSDAFPCPECNERDACYRLCEDRMDGEYDLVSVTSLFCNKCGHSWKNY